MSDEVSKLLAALRSENPSQADVKKWKSAISSELSRTKPQGRRWIELVAAMLVGLVVGAAFFGHKTAQEENLPDNATIEFVITKSQ